MVGLLALLIAGVDVETAGGGGAAAPIVGLICGAVAFLYLRGDESRHYRAFGEYLERLEEAHVRSLGGDPPVDFTPARPSGKWRTIRDADLGG
jgi:hypothetical protein